MLAIIIGCEGKGGSSNKGGGDGIYALYPDLPPDPGSEGKKTLEGIDSNNNGVRDDVEIEIHRQLPELEKAEQRAALMQEAKTLQKALEAAVKGDINEILKADRENDRSIECEGKKFDRPHIEAKFFTNAVVNTKERVEAHMLFSKALSGRTFSNSGDPIPCDSDKEKEAKAQAAFNAKTFNIQTAYNLPPDPGSEGKKTLEGIDSNNNGVRDDVEIAIYNYAPREDQEKLRQAMFQKAKSVESIVKADLSDLNTLRQIVVKDFRAGACLKQSSPRRDSEGLYLILKTVRNTPERSQASRSFFNALDNNGISYSVPRTDPNPCDYDKR
jgi:hypothetical protein